MNFSTFNAIMWKMFVSRKRHFIVTLIEILVPIVSFVLLAYARSHAPNLKKEIVNATINEPMSLDDIYNKLSLDDFNLWYTPVNQCTHFILGGIQETFNIPSDTIFPFNSEEELLNENPGNISFIVGVIFKQCNTDKLDYELKIYKKNQIWRTTKLYVDDYSDIDGPFQYINDGITALQISINFNFLKFMDLLQETTNYRFYIQEFPIPEHIVDNGINSIFLKCLPLVTILSFTFQCPLLLKRMIDEKSTGVKEYMKMIGTSSSILCLGWTLYCLICNIISVIVITFITKISFGAEYPLIEHTHWSFLFFFLLLYCMVSVAFAQLLASFSHNSCNAIVSGILFSLFSYFVPFYINDSIENSKLWLKIVLALFPNMALQYGYSAILVYESREIGIKNWSDFWNPGTDAANDVSLGYIFVIYGLQFIMFSLLSIYIENVYPGKYGIPKHWSYPFSMIFKRNNPSYDPEVLINDENCIKINNLCKRYGPENIINNLNWNLPKNEITVLLGKNGAGKTTLVSMITGMIAANSGIIKINGKDIRLDLDKIRTEMGLCTQHNLLFADLTLKEHLIFFSMLKGNSFKEYEKDVENILHKTNLYDKRNDFVYTLSGGMKRGLCLGIALLNKPKVLILDEPTSGMDPITREHTRDLLKELRKTTTILLTTHCLPDAENIADRIAFIDNGKIICYDSLNVLKEKYDVGNKITLTFDKSSEKNIAIIKTQILYPILKLKNMQFIQENTNSIVFFLPTSHNQYFSELFRKLENNPFINNIKLSTTTLVDIFLKIYDIDIKNQEKDNSFQIQEKMPTKPLMWLGLFGKRCNFFRKQILLLLPGILSMLGLFLVPMLFSQSVYFLENYNNKLNVTLKSYGEGTVMINEGAPKYNNIIINNAVHPQNLNFTSNDIIEVLEEIAQQNIFNYKKENIVAEKYEDDIITAMYSSFAIHSVPIAVNLATALFQIAKNNTSQISTTISPLEIQMREYFNEIPELPTVMIWLFFIPTGVILFSSSFIIFPYFEMSSSFLNLQFIMGVSKSVYWTILYLFDFIVGSFIISIVCIPLIFGLTSPTMKEYGAVVAIFTSFMFCILPYLYVFSSHKKLSLAISRYIISGMLIGIILTVTKNLLILAENEITSFNVKYLEYIFCIFPTFSLYNMSTKFAQRYVENYNWNIMDLNKKNNLCEKSEYKNPCCFNGEECAISQNYFLDTKFGILSDILLSIIFMCVTFLLWLIIWKIKTKPKSKCSCNRTIQEEEENEENHNVRLKVKELSSCYKDQSRINNISFDINKMECVGLLGLNGAGKSTVIKSIVKEEKYHAGKIALNINDEEETCYEDTRIDIDDKEAFIQQSNSQYKKHIGYCPQADLLNYYMTGYELIHHLALTKGYSKKEAIKVTNEIIKVLGFEQHKNKLCNTYSGGTKRKLATCLALLGNPKLIVLDEPTCGVDAIASLKLRNVLNKIKTQSKSSIILSSHNVEEIEKLCDRVIIINNAKLVGQGTLQDLLEKSGDFQYKIQFTEKNFLEYTQITKQLEFTLNIKKIYYNKYAHTISIFVLNDLSEIYKQLQKMKALNLINNYVISRKNVEDVMSLYCQNGWVPNSQPPCGEPGCFYDTTNGESNSSHPI